MKTKLIKTFVGAVALTGLATTLPAITIGDSGVIDGIDFVVDFGELSYVSDLSLGGLRKFGAWQFEGTVSEPSTSISIGPLNIAGKTNLSFDWEVEDTSDKDDFSYFLIKDLATSSDIGPIEFHNGSNNANGVYSGSVSQDINTGNYELRIVSAVAGDPDDYQLRVANLSLTTVPDSSLGFLGIATIFAVMGAHRRFLKKATA